jgi:hypothetical protein
MTPVHTDTQTNTAPVRTDTPTADKPRLYE